MQDLQMKKGPALPECWRADLSTHSGTFIRIRKEFTPGGSYRFKAREKNAGWRIDYFITSPQLKDRLKDAAIHTDIMGSDHCPVELQIDL